MGLAFDLLLTLLIELPIFALFFKRKKRPAVFMYGLLVNFISWPIAHILKISTDQKHQQRSKKKPDAVHRALSVLTLP